MISHRTAPWPWEVPAIRVIDTRDTLRRVERHALLAARGNANILITGQPGMGKTGIARFIHENSDRATRGCETVECGGVADVLIESALFGHLQGSFAGAKYNKHGLLETVAGGTIVLNNVDGLSLRTQGRLLRLLETGQYLRMGGQPVQIQPWLAVRMIACTSADLTARVVDGLFLKDLYIRLSVHRLWVPSPPAGTPAWRHQ